MNEITNSKISGTVCSPVDREKSTSEGATNVREEMLLRRNVIGDSSDSRPHQKIQQRNIGATSNDVDKSGNHSKSDSLSLKTDSAFKNKSPDASLLTTITQDENLPKLTCQLKNKIVQCKGDTKIAKARDFQSLKKCGYSKIIRIAIKKGNWEVLEDIISKVIHINMTDKESNEVNRNIIKSIQRIGTVNDVFIFAVKHNQLSLVKLLIKTNFDVNFGDYIFNPFLYAVSLNNIPIVDLLLKNGADVTRGEEEYWNRNPLLLAASKGYVECTQLLLEHNAKPNAILLNRSPLYCAAQSGSVKCAELLLSYGADFQSSDKRMGLIWAAVNRNHIEMVKFLSINNADINKKSTLQISPLTEAIKQCNVDILRLLVKKATINGGECFTAIAHNTIVCLNVLLNNGADVNEGDRSPSPLACAVDKKLINMVKYLKFKGAKFSSVDDSEYESKYNTLLKENGYDKQEPLMLRGLSFWKISDSLDRGTLKERKTAIFSLHIPISIQQHFLLGYWNDDENRAHYDI